VTITVIMDANGNVVGEPKGTDLDVQSYLNWLRQGL
jgi:hypothetical protein